MPEKALRPPRPPLWHGVMAPAHIPKPLGPASGRWIINSPTDAEHLAAWESVSRATADGALGWSARAMTRANPPAYGRSWEISVYTDGDEDVRRVGMRLTELGFGASLVFAAGPDGE